MKLIKNKKKSYLILLTLIILSSCNKKNDPNCSPETINSTWSIGKNIRVNYNTEFQRNDYKIIDGQNRLFEYNHFGAQCDNIYDDEWGEKLTFILKKQISNFEFVDDEIKEIKCFYQEYGAWVKHNQYQIKNGLIKGKKLSENEWKIEVSVSTSPLFTDEQPKNIEFEKIFYK